MFKWLFKRKKRTELPCEFGEWYPCYGYMIRNCKKCPGRQVRRRDRFRAEWYKHIHGRLYESYCHILGRNTFDEFE
jgi:hypothetical protein